MKMMKQNFRMWVGLLAVMLMLAPADLMAQSWLKKIGEGLKKVEDVSNALSGKETTADKAQLSEEAAEMAGTIGDAVEVEPGAFKIITHHPDFRVKVLRCEVSEQTCVIDLQLINRSSEDVTIQTGVNSWLNHTAYDDAGNHYNRNQFKIAVGNLSDWLFDKEFLIPAHGLLKARVQLEGVKSDATVFSVMKIGITSDAWQLGKDKYLTFRNLPILREGDIM